MHKKTKLILPKQGAIDQGMGYFIWAMHQRITNWLQLHPFSPARTHWTQYCTRIRLAEWFGAAIISVQWLRKYSDSHGCKLFLLFAYPTSNQDAKAIAKGIFNIMTQHAARLPTTLILDKESAFLSQVIEEKAGVLGIILKHATSKHAQTIGKFERSPAPIEQALKIATGERSSLWHKYVSLALLN